MSRDKTVAFYDPNIDAGTEPVIRVMVEAASHEQAQRLSDELAAIVLAELAL